MITALISILFYIVLIFMSIMGAFIVYHLLKYSINSELNYVMVPIFIIVMIGLISSSFGLFVSINWKNLISLFKL